MNGQIKIIAAIQEKDGLSLVLSFNKIKRPTCADCFSTSVSRKLEEKTKIDSTHLKSKSI
jgi:hypothetical protein